ncbi:vesicle transport through interaction with t-SNAREs 1A-like [Cryptosporidium sp. chipmunk genotype I]|uniref:vesicle transport through interaction with t-SNAREs 1A-like n=1 Tax=Cryptosporidium sp. chipmunk genotype I TaxID=1280935 RepID=UPI00351A16AE|nr:vesicle transport through interaction with t-SNAREs 1A-like [Cryptosporidium sp. chipmunk genotype I]
MPLFIPGIKKEHLEENFEGFAEDSIQEVDLLSEYFQELSSLIDELKHGKKIFQEEKVKYTEQEKAKYQALIFSSQRMLEIIFFEIHFNESNTRNYQDFQNYLKYKEDLSQIYHDFSKLLFSIESDNKNKEISNLPSKEVNLDSLLDNTNLIVDKNKAYIEHNMKEKTTKDYYLLQSKRLLEETNQYSQQILLNLNTQKEQLIGTDNKITNISKNIQDSSLLLDKMTKWWHQLI